VTHREKLTDHLIPSPIDYAADAEHVWLYDPYVSRSMLLNHAEAKALLRRLAARYPGEIEALVTEQREALQTAINQEARWCSWCEASVPASENYTVHLARHI
jgi:hypothetical protein